MAVGPLACSRTARGHSAATEAGSDRHDRPAPRVSPHRRLPPHPSRPWPLGAKPG